MSCIFCQIICGDAPAHVVFADDVAVAFLDRRPLFVGHTLLAPREHFETLTDLPTGLLEPFFWRAQRLARAVETGLGSTGSFVAINNRVSQSVAHLHVHVVPRNRKDGLRGFFWPRTKYRSDEHAGETAACLSTAYESSR